MCVIQSAYLLLNRSSIHCIGLASDNINAECIVSFSGTEIGRQYQVTINILTPNGIIMRVSPPVTVTSTQTYATTNIPTPLSNGSYAVSGVSVYDILSNRVCYSTSFGNFPGCSNIIISSPPSSIGPVTADVNNVIIACCNNSGKSGQIVLGYFGSGTPSYVELSKSNFFTGCTSITFSRSLFDHTGTYWVWLKDNTGLTISDPSAISTSFSYTVPPPINNYGCINGQCLQGYGNLPAGCNNACTSPPPITGCTNCDLTKNYCIAGTCYAKNDVIMIVGGFLLLMMLK